MNIFEFLRFPDITNNINAVLLFPSKIIPAPPLRLVFSTNSRYLGANIRKILEMTYQLQKKISKKGNKKAIACVLPQNRLAFCGKTDLYFAAK